MPDTPEQRFRFDEVAELYERHRPGYPEALFDDLFALSGIAPGGRILEIGCGTGKATLPLARRGHPMTCLEPGASLAQLTRRKLEDFAGVRVIERTFEEWDLEPAAYGLVVSAQAFHWISPEVRFARAAAALIPGGALAVVGNATVSEPSALGDEIDAAYAQHAPEIGGPRVSAWYAEDGPIPGLFAESGAFGPPTWRGYRWCLTYPVADYLGLLETHSDHRLLDPERRALLHAAVGRIIERHGGCIEVTYQSNLHLAHTPGDGSASRGGAFP